MDDAVSITLGSISFLLLSFDGFIYSYSVSQSCFDLFNEKYA